MASRHFRPSCRPEAAGSRCGERDAHHQLLWLRHHVDQRVVRRRIIRALCHQLIAMLAQLTDQARLEAGQRKGVEKGLQALICVGWSDF